MKFQSNEKKAMRKKIYVFYILITAIMVLNITVFAADGEQGLINWDKVTGEKIIHVNDGILPAEQSETQSRPPFGDYTLEIEDYAVKVNLYDMERFSSGKHSADTTFMLPDEYVNKFVIIRKGNTKAGEYRISDIVEEADSFEAEGRVCRIFAERRGGVLNLTFSIILDDTPTIGAKYDKDTRFVEISASRRSWDDGIPVNIALVKKADTASIGYITQAEVQASSVITEFKFIGSISEYVAVVNDGKEKFVCTDIEQYSSGEKAKAELSIDCNANSVRAELNANRAFYGINNSSYIIIAFYRDDDVLLDVKIAKCWQKDLTAEIPQGAYLVKAFAFDSLETIQPQTTEAQKLLE